jgi:hypothetical protein
VSTLLEALAGQALNVSDQALQRARRPARHRLVAAHARDGGAGPGRHCTAWSVWHASPERGSGRLGPPGCWARRRRCAGQSGTSSRRPSVPSMRLGCWPCARRWARPPSLKRGPRAERSSWRGPSLPARLSAREGEVLHLLAADALHRYSWMLIAARTARLEFQLTGQDLIPCPDSPAQR